MKFETKLILQMERTNQAIDWVIMALHGNELGVKDGPPELKTITPRIGMEYNFQFYVHNQELEHTN